jgi:hypothetical protein
MWIQKIRVSSVSTRLDTGLLAAPLLVAALPALVYGVGSVAVEAGAPGPDVIAQCERGHDPLAEACLTTGAKPRANVQRHRRYHSVSRLDGAPSVPDRGVTRAVE